MSDPANFQNSFGAALSGIENIWRCDPATARALTIHRNTSARAAQEALADNYPVVRTLVGEDAFSACAAHYADTHPPRDPRLCFYGEGFDRFLGAYVPFRTLGYLPDIAKLERLCTEALFAADATPFDGSVLDLDQRLSLHPATRIAHFASPAAKIWQGHQPGFDPDALSAIEWEGCTALVTRPGLLIVTAIDPPTAIFFEHCKEGATLGEAAAAVIDARGDISAIFAALILCGAFQNPTPHGET